jgi:hypothetical protein
MARAVAALGIVRKFAVAETTETKDVKNSAGAMKRTTPLEAGVERSRGSVEMSPIKRISAKQERTLPPGVVRRLAARAEAISRRCRRR